MIKSKRIDDIEILRAFAILMVVIEHMKINLIPWTTPALERFYTYFSGWTGVDLFFAISGFVIARDLVPRLQSCDNRLQYYNTSIVFWLRRFWRIIPSAWFWLAFILMATVLLNQSSAWGVFRYNFETVISALLQIANLHMPIVFGQFFPGAGLVYWSLSLEEQFYLLLPLLVLVSGRWLPYVLGAAILVQLLTPRDSLYLMMLRTDALLLGALLAIWTRNKSYLLFEPVFFNGNLILRLLILGLLLGSLASIGSDGLLITDYRFSMITLLSALLVLIASYNKNYISGIFGPLKKVLLWIGTRSYAIYLIHMPAYFLTREIWFRLEPPGTTFDSTYSLRFLLTALVILIVFSELNYRFIETPMRKHGTKVANRVNQRELPIADKAIDTVAQ